MIIDKEKIESQVDESFSMEDFLDFSTDQISPRSILEGEIVTFDQNYAYVNVGLKSDGRIPLVEFEGKPNIGDKVEILLKSRRLFDGVYEFSIKAAKAQQTWKKFLEWYNSLEDDFSFTGKVLSSLNNGKEIDCLGVRAFLPFSLAADLKKISTSDKNFKFIIKEVDKKRRSVIVSRQDFLEKELQKIWDNFSEKYKIDEVVKGKVIKIVEFGAFIRIDEIDGLLHRQNLSWKNNAKIKDYLKSGEEKDFVILDIDKEARKLSLGLKQLKPDPWLTAEQKYKEGDIVSGQVETIVKAGAFIEIEEGLDGFLHNSDLSWTKNNSNIKDYFQKGQQVELKVLSINQAERKLSLSYKGTLENPWETIETRFPIGSVHKRKIKNIAPFGLFVNLEEDIDGLINVSNISWEPLEGDLSQNFKGGEEVEFKILAINKNENKISCGLKQLQKSPWQIIKEKYPPRKVVKGTVSKIVNFGLYLKLEDKVEGFIHISELSKDRVEDISSVFKVGDLIEALVLGVEVDKRKLSLSKKHHDLLSEKKDLEEILKKSKPEAPPTLGDLLDFKLE